AAGLRAGPLSDDDVINQVSKSFVPVAVNLYKIREAPGSAGDLFRSVQRQRSQYQGIWIVSPDGKVLAGHHEVKNPTQWAREVLDTIVAALAACRPVQAREPIATDPIPNRGRGLRG